MNFSADHSWVGKREDVGVYTGPANTCFLNSARSFRPPTVAPIVVVRHRLPSEQGPPESREPTRRSAHSVSPASQHPVPPAPRRGGEWLPPFQGARPASPFLNERVASFNVTCRIFLLFWRLVLQVFSTVTSMCTFKTRRKARVFKETLQIQSTGGYLIRLYLHLTGLSTVWPPGFLLPPRMSTCSSHSVVPRGQGWKWE